MRSYTQGDFVTYLSNDREISQWLIYWSLEGINAMLSMHLLVNKNGHLFFLFVKSWSNQKLLTLIFVFENVGLLDSPGRATFKKNPVFF